MNNDPEVCADSVNHARARQLPGKPCAHCQRRCGTLAGGYALVAGHPVCSHPTDPDRPDCYQMIVVKMHRLTDCRLCMVDPPAPIQTPRRVGRRLNI